MTCDLGGSLRARFLAGTATRAERQQVLEHLVAGCEACRRELSAAWVGSERTAVAGAPWDSPARIEKLTAELARRRRDIETEEAEATRTLSAFLAFPVERQWLMIRNSRRVDTPAFCMQLLHAAFEAMYDDPRRALDLSDMALVVARRLDGERFSAPLCIDLVGRAWRHVGNARRALGDLPGAEKALRQGRASLAAGSGDPLEEAQQILFESSLLRAQRRLEPALRKARRARRLYGEVQDPHLEGLALLSEGAILTLMGSADEAVERIRLATERIDPKRDRHLALAAAHNMAWSLQEAGRVEEALAALERARPMYDELGDRASSLRLGWLEAKLHGRLGDAVASEARFRETIEGFAAAGLAYEVAAVSLDLVALIAGQGRVSELKHIAAETLVLFQSLGVTREAIAAWMVFQKATEAETVTAALIQRLAAYYAEAKRQPETRFEPAG